MSFDNKPIAVTGASSGIGAATAALLRERGARVIGLDTKGWRWARSLSTMQSRRPNLYQRCAHRNRPTTQRLRQCHRCAGELRR